ncbi:potassium transporter Kup [Acinetobacter junii]|jgi:KUP system potassium uptake protein|uniref:Probable potassium transport system protein Kup n=1 Tax=Acinetobacter junii CIP 107470 = MTCC 11364 TaxID=1217666 RepID=S7WLX8_ACIJU|nr:potassium transporter Kup [Acinetobacter junii]ENV50174.1 potassium uptake protein [Acinetobacter junii CIP 107470 = MTCC 11364]EPR82862.1 Kup system potassium uptake protein [Acinetobacter junii CIP 107470 = MTCC 11364]MCU4408644.1 potassium transporter Kup [Acinetobacter junii]TIE03975.1 potassium transporter Kup [Acinetobacter junii]HAK15864.1 potassium transporter Kup [Acinetobacter junii]
MQNQTVEKASVPILTLAALGVVFGDIGTSPLYALKESFHATHGMPINEINILGILSLIFWTIMLIVSLKYVMVIMRADNNGEGGIMALLALNLRQPGLSNRTKILITALGFIGASLFFGDGIITPAISVLSAVEGLSVAAPAFDKFILPISIGILTALFLVQKHGTAVMGKFFGPITLLWFLSIGAIGFVSIIQSPTILAFLSPHWALQFIITNPYISFFVMGAVVLTVTGGEALYADMGHFGVLPIRLGWFLVVLPCLMLNYAGQGALLLRDPTAITNPFYLLVPSFFLYPMILIATAAAVIASQALISGVFSMAKQAIQLGYLPRLNVLHTSASEVGQIYIPLLNWILYISILFLVLLFKTSSNLAGAYGLAVTITMFCDTLLVAFLAYSYWKWKTWKLVLFAVPFIFIDLVLLGSNLLKFFIGGWVPVLIAVFVFTLMMTWKKGRVQLQEKLQSDTLQLETFIKYLGTDMNKVSGIAVFLTGSPSVVPHALLHNLKHNKILHDKNMLVTVQVSDIPYVQDELRYEFEVLEKGFYRIQINYGFKEQPNVPMVLEQIFNKIDFEYNLMEISFFVSRERLIYKADNKLTTWRKQLFATMQKNTSPISDFYQIPTNRVVEIGSQIEI